MRVRGCSSFLLLLLKLSLYHTVIGSELWMISSHSNICNLSALKCVWFWSICQKNLLLIVACVAFYLINLNFLSKALSTYNLQSYVNVQMIIKCNNYWNVTDSQKRISDMVQNEYTIVKSAQLYHIHRLWKVNPRSIRLRASLYAWNANQSRACRVRRSLPKYTIDAENRAEKNN